MKITSRRISFEKRQFFTKVKFSIKFYLHRQKTTEPSL